MRKFITHTTKIAAAVLCVALVAISLAACGGKTAAVSLEGVDVYTYAKGVLSAKLASTGTNTVTEENGIITVNVAADVDEVEFDLAKFFAANSGFLGKKLSISRDDVTKGDGTLVKGFAWYQTGGDAGSRLFKKLGSENDDTVTAITKEAIAALPNREGEVRMYIITSGSQTGKHVVYLDATTGSSIETGETRVTFKFTGNNGKSAELKVKVVKAAE